MTHSKGITDANHDIVAIATMLRRHRRLGKAQRRLAPAPAPLPAKPLAHAARGTTHSRARNTGQAAAASTPESRSAAALALSHEPTFDEAPRNGSGSGAKLFGYRGARRVAGDTAEAKFVPGAQGPHDDLLRQRLLISGDLAPDKPPVLTDDVVAESVKRFQLRHGLAATGR